MRFSRSAKSDGWEVLVQTEGQGVEFLTPCIALKGPELVPPVFPPVFPDCTVLLVQSIVKEVCQATGNKGLRRERNVDHVIKLPGK